MVVSNNHFTSGQSLWAFSLSVKLHFAIDLEQPFLHLIDYFSFPTFRQKRLYFSVMV